MWLLWKWKSRVVKIKRNVSLENNAALQIPIKDRMLLHSHILTHC